MIIDENLTNYLIVVIIINFKFHFDNEQMIVTKSQTSVATRKSRTYRQKKYITVL